MSLAPTAPPRPGSRIRQADIYRTVTLAPGLSWEGSPQSECHQNFDLACHPAGSGAPPYRVAMTMLASLLDHLSTVSSPAPSATSASSQSTSSGTPLWVTLVVGLLGGVLGGAGAFAGAWRSSGALRQNTERTLEHERTRLLNERFSTVAELLGHDEAACRLAGVHAMAGLADDWTERRQTCIDVLCAYLRMPYYPLGPDGGTPVGDPADGQANREVRLTVIRTIRDHLLRDTPPETSWCGYDLDFTGATFDGGDFSFARFSGGKVSFKGAAFSGSEVSFKDATFSGGELRFTSATFSSGNVSFSDATFSGSEVSFSSIFSGGKRRIAPALTTHPTRPLLLCSSGVNAVAVLRCSAPAPGRASATRSACGGRCHRRRVRRRPSVPGAG